MHKGKLLAIIFLSLWFFISMLRFVYFLFSAVTQDVLLLRIDDQKKREQLIGDEYIYFKKLTQKLPDDSYCLFSENGKAFYIGRYFLYPKKIYWVKTYNEFARNNNCESLTLLTFNSDSNPEFLKIKNHYKLILIIEANEKKLGSVYKKTW